MQKIDALFTKYLTFLRFILNFPPHPPSQIFKDIHPCCQLKTFSPKSLPRHVRCCIHFFTSNTQKCRNFFKNFSFIQYAAFVLRQWFLPFFYVKSWSNLKPNGSFEICSSWVFQKLYKVTLLKGISRTRK